jgi:hypothetical protein
MAAQELASMSPLFWIGLAGLTILWLSWRFRSSSRDREIDEALRTGDLEPLIDALSQVRPGAQADTFHRAIRRFWDAYQREPAIVLVKELARGHRESPIAQYWIEHVRTVEPELARAALDQEFLETYYRPEVAAACGPVG